MKELMIMYHPVKKEIRFLAKAKGEFVEIPYAMCPWLSQYGPDKGEFLLQNHGNKFFEDICTVKELQDISQRLSVAKMLKEGKSYQIISKETGASTATISRVNRSLCYGSGGYKSVLEKTEG